MNPAPPLPLGLLALPLLLLAGVAVVLVLVLRRAPREPWLPFAPATRLLLAPGRYSLWVEAPRRFTGYGVDPDVPHVEIVHLPSQQRLALSGPSWFLHTTALSRRRYLRTRFRVIQPGDHGLHLGLAADRDPATIRTRLSLD